MTYSSAASLNDVASFEGPRPPSRPARWSVLRTALIGVATLGSAVVISTSPVTEPPLHVRAAIGRNKIADLYGDLRVGGHPFDLTRDSATSSAGRANGKNAAATLPSARRGPNGSEQATIAAAVALANSYGALPRGMHRLEPVPVFADPGSVPQLKVESTPSQFSDLATELADVSLTPPVTGKRERVPAEPKKAGTSAQSAPAPRPRRRIRKATRRPAPPPAAQPAERAIETATATAVPDQRNFFQKLFGVRQHPSAIVLAYAQPQDHDVGSLRQSNTSITVPFSKSHTAIYDISARVIYMPDGERLEAHSGYGAVLDDPRHVDEKDLGATPPHTYELAMRRKLFHGVRAIRLNPVGSGKMYGRTGFLAHPYMLGPKGDSNGCISIKHYSKFLQAFVDGDVRRLVVVSHLGSRA